MKQAEQAYRQRVARVVAAIVADPTADHSLGSLAALAHFSPFHFHRIYRGITGETLAATVRRVRLAHAARQVGAGREPITGIGFDAGYESPQAFTRAFRGFTGAAPAAFRRQMETFAAGPAAASAEVRVVERPAQRVYGLRHVGPAATIAHTHARLWQIGAAWPVDECLGVARGDVDADDFDYRAALVLRGPLPDGAAGFEAIDLPGGRYALHTLVGPYSQITAAVTLLYSVWLPGSGFEPDDRPFLESYRSPPDAPPAQLRTDLMIPVRALARSHA